MKTEWERELSSFIPVSAFVRSAVPASIRLFTRPVGRRGRHWERYRGEALEEGEKKKLEILK